MIGIMLIAITLPLFSGFIPQKNNQEITVDPQTLQALLDPEQEESDNMPVLPDIEGNYQIVDVQDGESLSVMYGQEQKIVKLIGVTVPEEMKNTAKKFLEQELSGTEIISLEFDVKDKDEEKNLLAYAYLPEDPYTTINSKLLMNGYAKLDKKTENQRYMEDLRSVEKHAREKGLGLWNKADDGKETKNDDR